VRRRTILLTAFLALALIPALLSGTGRAEPLMLAEDLADEIRVELNDRASYVYSYRYPQADSADPSAELINSFYRYRADDAAGFEIPMNADYYRGQDPSEDITVRITYTVTCNNDDFFSVLLRTEQGELLTFAGHTFSRKDIKPGSSVALPYLLGLLQSDETDTWLQDRQTAKADALVREMVWDRLGDLTAENPEIRLPETMEEEALDYAFFPEEDFYLDETGNPVFYLQPGFAEGTDELLCFPISIEEILDEM